MTRPHVLLIVAACAIVYANTLGNDFHLDDAYRVLDNPGVEQFWPPWRHFLDPTTNATLPRITQYRPIPTLTLSITHAISAGHNLTAYHLGNLLFQMLASVLVYWLGRELFDHWAKRAVPPVFALLAAVAFAVHPVSGIVVNYISSRDLLLAQLFMLATTLIYLRMRRYGATWPRWILCLSFFGLALLSKKNAAMLPAVLVLFEWLLAPGGPARVLRPWPFAAGVVALFAFLSLGLGHSDFNVLQPGDELRYLGAQAQHHLFHYLANFVWPFRIRQEPQVELRVWMQGIGGLFVLASWIAAFVWRRRAPLLVFCLLAYQALLVTTSSFLPLWGDVVDYRPYPSSAFLFLGAAFVASRRPRAGAIAMAVVVAYFAASSFAMNRTWKSDEALWRHSIAHGGTAVAHVNLAFALGMAHPESRPLLERALAIQPEHIPATLNLGLLEVAAGQSDEGLARIERAIELDPDRQQSWYWYAKALSDLGRHEAVLNALSPRAGWRAEYKSSGFYRAWAHHQLGQHANAIAAYRGFLASHPENSQAWFNLGDALVQQGDCLAAIDAFQKRLDLEPRDRAARLRLERCRRMMDHEPIAR